MSVVALRIKGTAFLWHQVSCCCHDLRFLTGLQADACPRQVRLMVILCNCVDCNGHSFVETQHNTMNSGFVALQGCAQVLTVPKQTWRCCCRSYFHTCHDQVNVHDGCHHAAASHVQVRCIAAVLLMVGRGQEQPAIVQQLLDSSRFPSKPQYSLAAEEPLLLFACGFEGIQWQRTEAGLSKCLAVVGSQLQRHLVAAALTSSVFEQLQQERAGLLAGQQQQQQHLAGEPEHAAGKQNQLQNGSKQESLVETAAAAAAAAADGEGKAGDSSGLGAAGAARWLAAKPPHIAMRKRATEPSIEERFIKAGIPLELLNKRGLPASMQE
jgi:hypothetical protein